jgi:hypothetical protein
MLLLPEPFGPTITLTPGENSRLTRSGKDLKPFIVIDLRYMPLILREPSGSRPRRTALQLQKVSICGYFGGRIADWANGIGGHPNEPPRCS